MDGLEASACAEEACRLGVLQGALVYLVAMSWFGYGCDSDNRRPTAYFDTSPLEDTRRYEFRSGNCGSTLQALGENNACSFAR